MEQKAKNTSAEHPRPSPYYSAVATDFGHTPTMTFQNTTMLLRIMEAHYVINSTAGQTF
jgi:hypothetical protein